MRQTEFVLRPRQNYDFDRVHTGRLTRGRIPAEIVYGARKVKTR